jgi:transposase-like protein
LRQLGFHGNEYGTNRFLETTSMARNQVQFQKGLSETEFNKAYGSEELCHAALVAWRWPKGFECPDCGGTAHCVVRRGARKLFQCNACHKQTSVRAGTMFASSKLPLRLWFAGMYHLTQTKQGISSLELSRRLGITQNAAWKMKHKLKQVMLERNAKKRLKGKIQMDDAYLGGERSGPPGRGAEGKTPFVAAVETTDAGKPHRIILRRVKAFSKLALRKLASTALTPGAEVVSDGLACFKAVTIAGCAHTAIVTGSGSKAAKTPAFKWVNTAPGNIKAALVGTYRAVREKHAARYLAEFEYRFNRRYDLAKMIPRLACAALTTAPMPYRLLKLADVQA